jgi:hypothetical protein
MGAVILRILASILPGWLSSNLMIIGIAAATVLVTNAVSGVVWYVKGHNSAAAQCHVATLIRERDELRRDLGVQKLTAEQASQLANELSEREAAREQKGAVAIPRDCENLARAVPHAPVALGKTDAGVAYWAEHDRLDTANDRIVATNTCQARQRKAFGEVKK